MASAVINVQILLRREWRNAEGVEAVKKVLTSLGISTTAAGLATVSADVAADRFRSLFGVAAIATPPSQSGVRDFGRSAGHVSPQLTVPVALQQYVESISPAPSHTYLQE